MIAKRVFTTLTISLTMLSVNSYAGPLDIVKPDIKGIKYHGGKWHIRYDEVKNGTNLAKEELFVDGNSDRVVTIGTTDKRGYPLSKTYAEDKCHKAYVAIYDTAHNKVAQSDVFNFGNTANCDNVIIADDIVKPVITLKGNNPQTLTVGEAYIEAGVMASDNKDGDVTNLIVTDSSAVNTNVAGEYTVTYDVVDAAGNDTTATRVVKVVELNSITKPVINIIKYYSGKWHIRYQDVSVSPTLGQEILYVNGVEDKNVNAGLNSAYGRGFPLNGMHDQTACNEAYIVVYDKENNEVSRSDVFNFGDLTKCGDTVKPEMTLVGADPQELTVGETYAELGVKALDNVDGDITSNVVIDSSAVDMTTAGTYTVTYNVSDAAGNVATTITRTVTVKAAPVAATEITKVKYYSGRWHINFIDVPVSANLGAEKFYVDGVLDSTINSGTTDPALVRAFRLKGTYSENSCHTAYMELYDKAGNLVSTTQRFNFGDTTKCGPDTVKPVLTLTGVNPQTLTVGDAYPELGATASDDRDGDVTGNIVIDSSAVDTSAVGTYTVTYNVADAEGNTATALTRTVIVETADVTKPVITLKGTNPQPLALGQAYVELGSKALDDRDGDISTSIVVDSSAINSNVAGSYVVIYTVSDAAGNSAVIKRTVVVAEAADSVSPVITLTGANPQVLLAGNAYVESGATALDNKDGDVSANIIIDSSAVNTAVAGEYFVNYTVSDTAGNIKSIKRRVSVKDAGTTAGDYYISLNGSDNNDGKTLGTAFKTIAHALEVANGGDTILMKGGEYRQAEIRYRKLNDTGKYITLQNYNNEKVVIKGSKEVTGWVNYQNNIWKLPAADNSGLNRNVHYQQVFYGEGKSLQKIGYPSYVLNSQGVNIWKAGFKRFDPMKKNANNPFGMSEGTFYVEKLANGKFDLYVWLPNGKTPNDANVKMEVSDEQYIIDAFNVKNMKFKGLTIMHTAASGYAKSSNGFQAGSALTVGYKAIIEDCEIAYTDFAAINLTLGGNPRGVNMQQEIRGSKIHHNGDIGVSSSAGGYLIENNEFYSNGVRPFIQYWHSGAIKTSANGWGEIKDNYIHDELGQGIWFDNCHSDYPIKVHHNYIDGVGNRNNALDTIRSRGNGMFFEQSTNVRAYNNIINMAIQRGIYASLSKDVVISNNLIRKSNLEQLAVRYRDDYGVVRFENVKVKNNIFMDNRGGSFDFKAFHESDTDAVFLANNEFVNNIIYNSDGKSAKIEVGNSHWSLDDNLANINPLLLTNGSTMINTWTLDTQSPAIDASTRYQFITDDIKHNPRNDGASDIGSFEN